MKPTIDKQTAHELQERAKQINELEFEIQEGKRRVEEGATFTVQRIIECGQLLEQCRITVAKSGHWLSWLAAHTAISERMAQHYIRIAKDPKRVSGAQSLRDAIRMLSSGDGEAKQGKTERELLPYLEALGRVHKLVGYIGRNPVREWPQEGREKLREDLEPIARELWPERFG
jgi:hypothetical protein